MLPLDEIARKEIGISLDEIQSLSLREHYSMVRTTREIDELIEKAEKDLEEAISNS